jgi:hypothetical protein
MWMSTVPVRDPLAFDAGPTRAVLRVCLCIVFGWLRQRAVRRGIIGGGGGAVNTNIHVHALVLEGVST